MSNKKSKPFEIKYVDKLPMVNVTGKFLVTNEARANLAADLKDFFPFFVKHYVMNRIRAKAERDENYILALSQRGGRIYLSRKSCILNIRVQQRSIGNIKHRISFLERYFSDITDAEQLRSKISSTFKRDFGLDLLSNVVDISTYRQLANILTGHKKPRRKDKLAIKILAVFLHMKGRCLWPLRYYGGTVEWMSYHITTGLRFCEHFLRAIDNDSDRTFIHIYGIGFLRAVRWRTFNDLTEEDISALRQHIHATMGSPRHIRSALNKIVKIAVKAGCHLTYESAATRTAKMNNKGKEDGTFSWLDLYGSRFKHWQGLAVEYVSFRELRKGVQRSSRKCSSQMINRWFDYVNYLDEKGVCIRSLKDVSRADHIKFRPEPNRSVSTFTEWLVAKSYSPCTQKSIIYVVQDFFKYIIDADNLTCKNPVIREMDAPRYIKRRKTFRPALTLSSWIGIIEMLYENPPIHRERIAEKGTYIWKRSPSLQTYMLIRLLLSIRHCQAAYLDMNAVLHPEGILISGDKNLNRKDLLIAPNFDKRLEEKIRQCIEWQKRYNHPVNPVWYNKNVNSPYGKVIPLFRPIDDLDGRPFGRSSCEIYMRRAMLKYQKIANLSPEEHVVLGPDKRPFNMSKIDPDTMLAGTIEKCFSTFDLHSLRVTAATVWYEAGIPLDMIGQFLTGHASLSVLTSYIKRRNMGRQMQIVYETLKRRIELEKSGMWSTK